MLARIYQQLHSIKIKQQIESIPAPIYAILLTLFSVFYFFRRGVFTAFEWTTTLELPIILRLLDPMFLSNDFLTNALIQSPRQNFSYVIYFLVHLGFDLESILYLIKVFLFIAKPIILFLAIMQIFNAFKDKRITRWHEEIIKAIIFLCSMGLLILLQGETYYKAPAGWGALQFYSFLSPMTLSFVLGISYIYIRHSTEQRNILAIVTLLLSSLIHPVIALCSFTLAYIFYFPFKSNRNSIIICGLELLISIAIPIILLTLSYKVTKPLDAKTFIYQLVNVQHSLHYLMSKVIGWQTIQ